ncbi:MAG: NADH:flavin oxidoreductase [Verrucomicrobiales bacterium]|nr:NADH:flavin oxidoreductase [Verrucomicrobiales bacterium]
MSEPFKLTRIPSLKTVEAFRAHVASLGQELPCEDQIEPVPGSPLAQPVPGLTVNGRTVGNRWAIHPMEGWDATTDGCPTPEVCRRWERFGESGAKLIWGGEAMAVRSDGRANPHQLMILESTREHLRALVEGLRGTHRAQHGSDDDLVVGFQLTHSGRFCRPTDKQRLAPRVAYRHPILDAKFGVTGDDQVLTNAEVEELIGYYVQAARIAREAGADFIDVKHCHGYLLHEFLSAHTRPGKYGGSFENRTRPLREIVERIRADGNDIAIGVRLSAFDFVPFRPDPERAEPGRKGPGIPEEFGHCLPYRYGFGVNPENPVEPDLTEPRRFIRLCADLGIRLLNLSAGSPYYNPHIQRPAAYPPSDGYQPAHDPLIDVARQIQVVRSLRAEAPKEVVIVGTGYTYLQEYLPHVAQGVVRQGWADLVGVGRMVLSYPRLIADSLAGEALQPRFICRTFSDCTTAPRNGLISGCYPLDRYYADKPEFLKLKDLKSGRA